MAVLTAAQRNKLPKREFGVPGERRFPMPDKAHARNALARVSQGKGLSHEERMHIIRKAKDMLKKG